MAITYPRLMSCQDDDCNWTHDAHDEDDAIDAWEAHMRAGCPQRRQQANTGPDDPIGTVRATPGTLAVRAHSAIRDATTEDDLAWFVINVSHGDDQDLDGERVADLIGTWPIVYQP